MSSSSGFYNCSAPLQGILSLRCRGCVIDIPNETRNSMVCLYIYIFHPPVLKLFLPTLPWCPLSVGGGNIKLAQQFYPHLLDFFFFYFFTVFFFFFSKRDFFVKDIVIFISIIIIFYHSIYNRVVEILKTSLADILRAPGRGGVHFL